MGRAVSLKSWRARARQLGTKLGLPALAYEQHPQTGVIRCSARSVRGLYRWAKREGGIA